MFDISLSELLTIFLIGMLVLKPKDVINIFAKIKNFNATIVEKDFLDFKTISTIEEKENKCSFKYEGARKKKKQH